MIEGGPKFAAAPPLRTNFESFAHQIWMCRSINLRLRIRSHDRMFAPRRGKLRDISHNGKYSEMTIP
jgi:hypothetical protein